MQSVKGYTLIIALMQCWTVSSCQTPSLGMVKEDTQFWASSLTKLSFFMLPLTHLFHVFLPLPLLFVPSTCNSLHADTQSRTTVRRKDLSNPYVSLSYAQTLWTQAKKTCHPSNKTCQPTLTYPSGLAWWHQRPAPLMI